MNENTGQKSGNYNEIKVKLEYLADGLYFAMADN